MKEGAPTHQTSASHQGGVPPARQSKPRHLLHEIYQSSRAETELALGGQGDGVLYTGFV